MKTLLCLVVIALWPYSYGHSKTSICTQLEQALDIYRQRNELWMNGYLAYKVFNVTNEFNDTRCMEIFSTQLQNLKKTQKINGLEQFARTIVHLKNSLKQNLSEDKECQTERKTFDVFLKSLKKFLTALGPRCHELGSQ